MRRSIPLVVLASLFILGVYQALVARHGVGKRLPEAILASTRGTNNQYVQNQDANGSYLFYTCANMNQPPGITDSFTCANQTNNTACMYCNSQTMAPSVDTSQTTPTGGWSAANNNIVCSGYVITGGACQGGTCTGGMQSSTACTTNVNDWVKQPPNAPN